MPPLFKIPPLMPNPYTIALPRQTGIRNHAMTLRGETPSNVLFIVDPQNDFSDSCPNIRPAGSLYVAGSTADYARIIQFLKNNDIQEVHVSLDTHSERHIAHPGFWEVSDTGLSWVNATDENSQLRELRIDENGNIAGRNLLSETPDLDILYYRPRHYGYTPQEYATLCAYVQDYIKFFYQPANILKQKPMIWPHHCIERSRGHRVAAELQKFLERWVNREAGTGPATKPRILRYHNKGRNNLVEMYSAFSADRPMTAEKTQNFLKAVYDGRTPPTFDHNADGHANYANHSTNLNTERNDPLIEHLLRNNNHVYFCGEARTHCVKATLLDVMQVVLENPTLYSPGNVELLQNMSSPIAGHTDDIARIMRENGFSVSS